MFIVTNVFPMELFVQRQGEGQETPRVLNTPQEESKNFKVIILLN